MLCPLPKWIDTQSNSLLAVQPLLHAILQEIAINRKLKSNCVVRPVDIFMLNNPYSVHITMERFQVWDQSNTHLMVSKGHSIYL